MPVSDFVLSLTGAISSNLTTVKTNAGKVTSQNINGISYETLTPDSLQMFAALRDDKFVDFLAGHTDFIGN